MYEPVIALAATPRDWAQRLHRYVADHGGARVRTTVLHSQEALAERYDVLLADDTTSFLTHHLLDELRRQGRRLLGVYDPDDPTGKSELLDLGADDVIDRFASAEGFVEAIQALAGPATARPLDQLQDLAGDLDLDLGRPQPGSPAQAVGSGRVTAVGSPSGGCGATEVAIGLATAVGHRGEACVLVDADEVAPSVAQRLGLPLYPNLRAAVDAVEHRAGPVADALRSVPGSGFKVLAGLSNPRDWTELRAGETLDVIRHLASTHPQVVVNVGHRIEELPGVGSPPRYGQTRTVLGAADAIVGVGMPTPVGVTRLLEWVADVRTVAAATPVHLVLNRAPGGMFRRAEVEQELSRTFVPASLWFVPDDVRVAGAAWSGALVTSGPFAKAVTTIADEILTGGGRTGGGRVPRRRFRRAGRR
ncbi:MAG: hypothetical protein M3N52_03075 [Actinomycetota bacterium]|nr:hypothetical protein [Actinomycetota bacterium]